MPRCEVRCRRRPGSASGGLWPGSPLVGLVARRSTGNWLRADDSNVQPPGYEPGDLPIDLARRNGRSPRRDSGLRVR